MLDIFAQQHAVFLERYKGSVVNKILAFLNRLDADLVRQIAERLEQNESRLRLEHLLAQIRVVNDAIAASLQRELELELREFAPVEIAAYAEAIQDAIAVPASIYAPAPAVLVTAALSDPLDGKLIGEWVESYGAAKQARIRDQIRLGFADGETTEQVVRRIKGTRKNQYRDGVLEISRRDARTVVRSSLAALSAKARDETFNSNSHIFDDKIRWLSHLDGRTSSYCRVRDKKLYRLSDKKPIGHDLPWLEGAGRIHPSCRSTSIAITRDYKSMGLDLEEPPPGTVPFVAFEPPLDKDGNRIQLPKPASKMSVAEYTRVLKKAGYNKEEIRRIESRLIGQVPEDTDYEKFLRTKSRDFVSEVLGKSKAKLFLDGGLHLRDLVTAAGDELPLSVLRERERAAWKRAGLSD